MCGHRNGPRSGSLESYDRCIMCGGCFTRFINVSGSTLRFGE